MLPTTFWPLTLLFALQKLLHFATSETTLQQEDTVDSFYPTYKICNRDEYEEQHSIRRRYVVDGRRWVSGRTLSWSFRDRFQLIKKESQYRAVKEVIRRALQAWSDSSRRAIVFKDVSPKGSVTSRRGQLDIQFAKFDHGDKEAFDGRGGIVAHSAYPPEGIVHFDASEHWSTDGRTGLDLRFVALHEIGHVLGLRHSKHPKAVMHPYYRNQLKDGFRLSEDDIRGIRSLYPLPEDSSDEPIVIDESSERYV